MPACVQVSGVQEADSAVVVLVVVPVEELLRPGAGVLDALEAPGVVRPVLQCLEISFDEGIIVTDPRPGVAFRYGQLAEQFGDGAADHGAAPV